MATGCFVSSGRSLERALERVKLADSLGFESVFTTHIAGAESLTMLTAFATVSERVRLGTGVVPIYTRTPATMAQTAATIDALSGGRFTLGLGVSHRPVVEGWHGQTIDRPASEMREYVSIVRAILQGESPPEGEKWRTSFALSGLPPRPELPIFIAALSPRMLRLAGEIADGVILWLCNPDYIRDVVVPEVSAGRERAGKALGRVHGRRRGSVGVDRRSRPRVRRDPVRAAHLLLAARSTGRCSSGPGSREDIEAFDARPATWTRCAPRSPTGSSRR